MAKSSYSLHPIKLKLHVQLDHDVEQSYCFEVTVHQILAELPLRKCLLIFCFRLILLQFTSDQAET